jgi:hypothetical protein
MRWLSPSDAGYAANLRRDVSPQLALVSLLILRQSVPKPIMLIAASSPQGESECGDNNCGNGRYRISYAISPSDKAMPVYSKIEYETGETFLRGLFGIGVIVGGYALLKRLGVRNEPRSDNRDK